MNARIQAHPMARKRSLVLKDLAGEPMVTFSREQRSVLFDAIVALCMNAGCSPRLIHVARHPMSLFQIVRLGLGVSIVPMAYEQHAPAGLQFVPIDTSNGQIHIDAIWRKDNPSESLRRLMTTVLAERNLPL